MGYLMPRYELDAASLNQLLAYFMQQPDDVERDGVLAASMTEQDALVLWLNPSALKVFPTTTMPPARWSQKRTDRPLR